MNTIDAVAGELKSQRGAGVSLTSAIQSLKAAGTANLLIVAGIAAVQGLSLQQALQAFQDAGPFQPTDRELEMLRIDDLRATVALKPVTEIRTQIGPEQFDPIFDEICSIPWGQVVHFFGRARDFPQLILNLVCPETRIVEKALVELGVIEHQTSVIQATPLGTHCMLQVLPHVHESNYKRVTVFLLKLLQRIESNSVSDGTRDYSLDYVMRAEFVWPPFVSEEEDEYLWEMRESCKEEYDAWHQITCTLIRNAEICLDS